jgi:hypothetical protein
VGWDGSYVVKEISGITVRNSPKRESGDLSHSPGCCGVEQVKLLSWGWGGVGGENHGVCVDVGGGVGFANIFNFFVD